MCTERMTHQIWCTLTTFRNFCDTEGKNCATHRLPVLVFVQLAVKVEFEVHEFSGAQCDDDLPLVGRGAHDGLA